MAFYLFPGVMYERFRKTDREHTNFARRHSKSTPSLENAYKVYELSIKQYLGSGSILQFVPGTIANRARQQLSNELKPAMEALKKEFAELSATISYQYVGDIEFYFLGKYSLLLPLYSYLNIGPLFKLLDEVADGFDSPGINRNKKFPLLRIAFMFPILTDIFYVHRNRKIRLQENALKNVIHTVLNPIRLLDNALNFFHLGVNRILDIGSEQSARSSLPRTLLKGLAGLIFGLVKIPVKILKFLIDLPLETIKTLIVDPLVHIATCMREAYENDGNVKALIVTAKELQDVKELRRTAKGREDTSYKAITRTTLYNTAYIGITKSELYGEDPVTHERLVAIKGSSDKITKITSLLSIVNLFSAQQKIAKNEAEAVEEAKSILSSPVL